LRQLRKPDAANNRRTNMKFVKQDLLMFGLCCLLLLVASVALAQQAEPVPATPVVAAQQTPQELQQMAAPIALYPDSLIAQILAAATYPDQIVEADRWMQEHSNLKGEQLGQQVDKQPWDPSVKALTEFPSVLANMDKNLSWTSSLGDAYFNQQQDLMNAIQVMRRQAENAGNLKTTAEETVTSQDQTIVIQPANPEVVYVPEYDPWLVYGSPIAIWPGWYSYPGLFIGGPGLYFGAGFEMGFFGGYGWGWHHWDPDWHNHTIMFDHNTYISRSRTFTNRDSFYRARGNFNHGDGIHSGGVGDRPGARGFAEPRNGGGAPGRGIGESHGQSGSHAGAFSGFNHGGAARGFSMRGQSSFGGGFHGGGGSHGGGGGHR
jgi:uncharacterized membrane protein YgcG